MVHPDAPGGVGRPHTARSAALVGCAPRAAPASPHDPVRNMPVPALSAGCGEGRAAERPYHCASRRRPRPPPTNVLQDGCAILTRLLRLSRFQPGVERVTRRTDHPTIPYGHGRAAVRAMSAALQAPAGYKWRHTNTGASRSYTGVFQSNTGAWALINADSAAPRRELSWFKVA